jgi:hypothetical protein
MQIRIKGEKEEGIIEYWLEQDGETIYLIARNTKDLDSSSVVLLLSKDGTFSLTTSVDIEGIQTDKCGRIIETK